MVINEEKQLIFKAIPDIAYKQDPSGALSMIPPKVLMIQDVRKCYKYKIGSIGDMEIREEYGRLCENVLLREEFKILEKKGLTIP